MSFCLCETHLDWKTQVSGDDDARPDLVGNDAAGAPRVILEAKFWAGLTENQPVTYLKRLPSGGVLCVVGPAKRHSLLVGELARRIAEASLTYKTTEGTGDASVASVSEATLIVLSWRLLVDAIIADAERAGERDLAENARQLQGLCDEQDSQAFLPLSKEELSAHGAYSRIIQFGELVDDLADRLGPEAKRGLRTTRGDGFYGRYLWLRGVGVLLICDIRKWLKFGYTPLWLSAYGPTFKEPGACRDALAPARSAHHRQGLPVGRWGADSCIVPAHRCRETRRAGRPAAASRGGWGSHRPPGAEVRLPCRGGTAGRPRRFGVTARSAFGQWLLAGPQQRACGA